jgi:hypothetical protein
MRRERAFPLEISIRILEKIMRLLPLKKNKI